MTRRSSVAWRLQAACAAALLGFASPASAQDAASEARAKELFENGQILYDEGRYDDAIAAWQEAYRLTSYPDLLFNVSNAYERAGKYKEALEYLNKYRAFATAEERPTLDRRIAVMEQRAKEQEAEAARVAELQARATQPEPAPAAAPAPSSSAPATSEPSAKDGGGVRVLPIVLLGTGVAGLGVGTAFGIGAQSALGQLQDTCVDGNAGLLCPTSAQDAANARGSRATASAVSFGVGGALTIGGVLAAVIGGGSGADVWVVPDARPDGGGLSVDGRF